MIIKPPKITLNNAKYADNRIIGKARALYESMAKSMFTDSYNFKRRVFEYDINISIQTNKISNIRYGFINIYYNINIVKSDEKWIYLESGFYDILSWGKCVEATYYPAILKYNQSTLNYINSTNTPLQGKVKIIEGSSGLDKPFEGEKLLDGFESNSLGCKEKKNTVVDGCGNIYSNGGYCSPNIWIKKYSQVKVPSSSFSGKLRLFIQSLYGSPRSDYQTDGQDLLIGELTDTQYPRIQISGNFETGKNAWLYTTSNYNYFICIFKGDRIEFRAIDVSDIAKTFIKILKNHPRSNDFEFVTKIEAYILSTAKISNRSQDLIIQGPSIYGSPLYHGWHVSWKGDIADIITSYKGQGGLQPEYIANHHQIKITEVINDDGTISFSATNTIIESNKNWWPWTSNIQLFFYDSIVNSMVPVDYPAPIFNGYEGSFDAPIYCYRTLDIKSGTEELKVCRISMNLHNIPTQYISLPHGAPIPSLPDLTDVESRKFYNNLKNGSISISNGISVFNIPYVNHSGIYATQLYADGPPKYRGWPIDRNGPTASITYPTSNEWAIANGVSIGQTKQIPNPNGSGNITVEVSWRTIWFFVGRVIKNQDSTSQFGKLFGQILLQDCESFLIVINEESTGVGADSYENRLTSSVFNGVFYPAGGQLVWDSGTNTDGYKIYEVIAGSPPDAVAKYNAYDTFINVPIIESYSNPLSSGYIYKNIYYAINNISNLATISNYNILNEYFSPTISDKPTHTIDTCRKSLHNEYEISHGSFSKNENFITSYPVGWQ